MRRSEPGETAVGLPWLAPGTAALVALARCGSTEVWPRVRTDPGAVLLLAPSLSDESPTVPSSVLAHALRHIIGASDRVAGGPPAGAGEPPAPRQRATAAGFVDWNRRDVAPVYRAAIAFARLSEDLARTTGACDPFRAWAAGLLAPLGWMAVAAVEPEAVGECLREPVYADDLPGVQRQLWRMDAHAIARRLARRWDLPDWLRFAAGDLALPADTAASLGADDRLFRVAQLAVAVAQANGYHLGLPVGTSADELSRSLGLTGDDLRTVLHRWRDNDLPTPERWTDPHAEPLLPDVLGTALDLRRREEGPAGESLEREIDRLHEALLTQRTTETERLHRMKLRSLAELAAGAGHEINNPLAVISGQSQYLLAKEGDPEKQKALQSIVRQAERVHQILMDLMQFARPPQPRRQPLDLRATVADVLEQNRARAAAKSVALEFTVPVDAAPSHADAAMVRTALGNLVRNGIEAASTDGWVRLSLEAGDDSWEIAVEDSGPGPDPAHWEHLFDPFYSGRYAGRGRGLGLSTAWRLVRENNGDVRFDPLPDRPSRFILILPRATPFTRDESVRDCGTALKIA